MKRCLMLIGIAFLLFAGIAFTEETTVIDNDNVSIRILGFEKNLLSYNMSVMLENKTDSPLTFTMTDTTVNGIDVTVLWGADVPAKSEKKSTVSWYDLESDGIEDEVSVISGTFRAYYNENWALPDAASQDFVVYPQENNRIVITDREETHEDGTITAVDNDQFLITVDSFTNTSLLYCYSLTVSLENRTENPVMFTVRDVTVNGKPCDPFWAAQVEAGEHRTETIGWFADSFEQNDIETVTEIEMTFVAYGIDSPDGEDQLEQRVTLNP